LKKAGQVITVFGSSRPREGDADYAEARALGAALAGRGFAVCSGGYGGVMEGVSRGAKEAGGRVIGVTADFFSAARVNRWVDEEIRVATWEQRLFRLIELGDGFVACKGGTGTLVELAVVWEMLNKRVMAHKPFVVLGDFWQPVIERVREVEAPNRPSSEVATPATGARVASPWNEANNRLILVAKEPAIAVEILAARLSHRK
jgi:uncharacterized protein (TIGR00730 family)